MTKLLTNDPTRAGQNAWGYTQPLCDGRYTVFPVHTRFDAIKWFVLDRDTDHEVIRQGATKAEAVDGLEV